ncbi:transcriptional regulator, TetR family [Amycolatopsis lurida]|uniref:TetR family transcriptional regulator n=1 Tax=Amycolatopsis lurida NRRL 2430 TaxID=1460371 RepID=A0A2P2FGH1_AMYLU|nr:TetR/AcrR family transcriptional regulator [Amycolatopsis lurida]KFU75821.1 TetR family transcriptional regulator [Amycolatopsis lurida NRRL 2430]SEE32741.1 transcriptional regulator, TetR family [Amycolatopsis lurida]
MATTKTTAQTPGRRRRTESKRAAILDAAEWLFVTDGYELTSVDAIAARAQVSKRTVYDHFGDKRTLYGSVLARVHESVTATVRDAVDQELTEDRDLGDALTAFAMRVVTEAFPSSSYVAHRRLTSQGPSAPRLPEAVHERPERLLEERFALLAAAGELRVPDPRRAAKHFTALTVLLALEALREDPTEPAAQAEIPAIIADGVDAFLRAYRR